MSKNNDFLSTLKTFTTKLNEGEKSPAEMATALNSWLKEGGEALKVKIEDEVERSVSKMGFIKRGEFEALKQEVAALKVGATKSTKKKAASKKTSLGKKPVQKIVKKSAKKAAAKKVAQ
jgi:BMFP domain-containing protein YqiC